ncbi:ABC transporter ATP-binding protein [bacterium]|nr:ABC transporter ATP-binding protein [bacterium]
MNKLINEELKKHKIGLLLFFVIYIIDIILSLLEPVIFGEILDIILSNFGTRSVAVIHKIILLCIIVLISFIFTFLYRRIIFSTGRKVKQGVFSKLLQKTECANISFFENIDKGTFVSYIINDINQLWSIIGHGFIEITRVLAYTIIGFIISIKYVNFSLTISVFIIFPIFLYLIIKQNSKSQKLLKDKKDLEAALSQKINDGFCGFTVIKSYVKEKETVDQFNDINQSLKEKNIAYHKVIAHIDVISTICKGLSFSIACIYGIYLVVKNVITIGEFIAFNSIIQKVLSDYVYTGNLVKKVNELKIINKRIQLLYNINLDSNGNKKMPETPNISIKNLNFKYNNESNNILEDININIPYGSFIGILGKTGSGKTTLANILTKFYKIENKKVFFDNIDINDINRTSFYEKMSYVMQEDYIYDNIVKYNIDLGKYYTETKIKKALEQSELLNTIENFPQKYETYIGEDGIKISGGQKQRLILSRNIVSTPKILIIDDGLTGLDLETRKKIIENITKNKNITLIVISNMIEDIKEADKIYILENKTLKELEV